MATIRIAETGHPSANPTSTAITTGGAYSRRNGSRSSLDGRSFGRGVSIERRTLSGDHEAGAQDEDSGLRHAGDYKTKQVFRGKMLFWLAYQSIGVIYGDIGTSPLYMFSSTFSSEPLYEDLVGILSIVIWSLTLMVTVKYVLVILHADNEGEGGTFSCYTLLSRYANITKRSPKEASLVKMERYRTDDLKKSSLNVRTSIEKSRFARGALKTIGVLAVSMVMSDGVLTPAQSVLGAVQGLRVVKPSISDSTVVGTTCGILVLLFAMQPLGTSKIAAFFAPVVLVWLSFNASFGIYNLVKFDHSVLKAFNPGYAFEFMIRRKTEGWRMLGGVLLAFTGVEALFADLGAFSRRAIQLSWLCFAFPCLLLAYVGQAAYISVHPAAYANPFFNAVPPGMLIPSLIIAVLAAIVASQAIITATFQLVAQIMKLSYIPQVKVVHTSTVFHGQLYVPFLNWLLMIGTVAIAAIYNNTTSLGNAYGVCVMFVTLFDTCMISLAALVVWRIHPLIVFPPFLTIACLDGVFLSSALEKVPDGAWFTITLASILAGVFILWRFGKEQQWAAEALDHFPTNHLVKVNPQTNALQLTPSFGGGNISTIKGFGIFFDKSGEMTPAIFIQFLSKLVAAPEIIVFFHLRPLEMPTVVENRYTVSRLSIPNCYRLIIRHGYMDEVVTRDLAPVILEQVRDFVIRQGVAAVPSEEDVKVRIINFSTDIEERHAVATPVRLSTEEERQSPSQEFPNSTPSNGAQFPDANDKIAAELKTLQDAYDEQVLYVVGKEEMVIRRGTVLWRRVVLSVFLWLRDNTRTKMANLGLPVERLVEVGFVKEV